MTNNIIDIQQMMRDEVNAQFKLAVVEDIAELLDCPLELASDIYTEFTPV